MRKLAVIVLGNRNSGKSHTWNTLFGRRVITSKKVRRLDLPPNRDNYVEVFLISASAEERKWDVKSIIGKAKPNIVLCSVQNTPDAQGTIDYFVSNGFDFYIQWLNPNYGSGITQRDSVLITNLRNITAEFHKANGNQNATVRVQKIANYIRKWAQANGLLRP